MEGEPWPGARGGPSWNVMPEELAADGREDLAWWTVGEVLSDSSSRPHCALDPVPSAGAASFNQQSNRVVKEQLDLSLGRQASSAVQRGLLSGQRSRRQVRGGARKTAAVSRTTLVSLHSAVQRPARGRG